MIYKTEFQGNQTLGLFCVTTEDTTYIPTNLKKTQIEKISKTLNTEVIPITIYNSFLIGLFSSSNSKYFFVPEIIKEEELKQIKEKIIKIVGVYTTIGNLILCNDKGCILSPYLRNKKEYFTKELKLKTEVTTISGLPFPGAFAYVTNKGGVIHKNCKDEELEILESILKVKLKVCEFYDGFPGAEILANSNGLIIPKTLRGQELSEIQEGLKIF